LAATDNWAVLGSLADKEVVLDMCTDSYIH